MEPIVEKYHKEFERLMGVGYQLIHVDSKTLWSEKLSTGRYVMKNAAGSVAAKFSLVPMINCCGIVVSTQAEVTSGFQGKGLGTLLNSFRIDLARHKGYGVLLCTDVESNEPQRRVLKKNGWKDIFKFVNPRTKNVVCISVINL